MKFKSYKKKVPRKLKTQNLATYSAPVYKNLYLTLSLLSRPKPAANKYAIIPKPAVTGRWNSLCFDALSPPP